MSDYDREREARELEFAVHQIQHADKGALDIMAETTALLSAALARAEAHGRAQAVPGLDALERVVAEAKRRRDDRSTD